nr:MAG TPA: hypothetical protein [Bacteriophage sp.]
MIRFYVSYPTDRPVVIRYFYLKNSDMNLAINPYLTKRLIEVVFYLLKVLINAEKHDHFYG